MRLGQGNDRFAFEQSNHRITPIKHYQSIHSLVLAHVAEDIKHEFLVAAVDSLIEWKGWLYAPDAEVLLALALCHIAGKCRKSMEGGTHIQS
jgi:hypothetical protein